jgi:hypothetical protein
MHSWASAAMKSMKEQIETMNHIEILGTPIDIRSTLKVDREAEIDELADTITASLS